MNGTHTTPYHSNSIPLRCFPSSVSTMKRKNDKVQTREYFENRAYKKIKREKSFIEAKESQGYINRDYAKAVSPDGLEDVNTNKKLCKHSKKKGQPRRRYGNWLRELINHVCKLIDQKNGLYKPDIRSIYIQNTNKNTTETSCENEYIAVFKALDLTSDCLLDSIESIEGLTEFIHEFKRIKRNTYNMIYQHMITRPVLGKAILRATLNFLPSQDINMRCPEYSEWIRSSSRMKSSTRQELENQEVVKILRTSVEKMYKSISILASGARQSSLSHCAQMIAQDSRDNKKEGLSERSSEELTQAGLDSVESLSIKAEDLNERQSRSLEIYPEPTEGIKDPAQNKIDVKEEQEEKKIATENIKQEFSSHEEEQKQSQKAQEPLYANKEGDYSELNRCYLLLENREKEITMMREQLNMYQLYYFVLNSRLTEHIKLHQ